MTPSSELARPTLPLGQAFPSILAAARTGAEWAWSEIYAELAPAIVGYLRAQRAAEPEDVAGEVFLQLVRDLPCFQGDEPAFRAWALTIAHHRLVDARRRSNRRPVEPAAEEIIVRRGPVGDAEEDAFDSLATARVSELIGGLPRSQRDVPLLRILGGLTVEQAARAIGKRPGAAKALQRRSLAALERALSREGVTL